jgi:hypothetical protein
MNRVSSHLIKLSELTSSASERGLLRVTSRLISTAWGSIMCWRERERERERGREIRTK